MDSLRIDEMSIHDNGSAGYRDETDTYTSAVAALNTGELVCDPSFSLADSIGAIEIGDAKMDSGLVSDAYEPFDAAEPLTPRQVVWVLDRILACEMSWHMGHALLQTVFSSEHVLRVLADTPTGKLADDTPRFSPGRHDPQSELLNMVLWPFVCGVIKTCDLARRVLLHSQLHPDEDMNTDTCGVSLLEATPADAVVYLLQEALQWPMLDRVVEGHALRARLLLRRDMVLYFSHRAGLDRAVVQAVRASIQHKPAPAAFSSRAQRLLASTMPPRPVVVADVQHALDVCERLADGVAWLAVPGICKGPLVTKENYLWIFAGCRDLNLAHVRAQVQVDALLLDAAADAQTEACEATVLASIAGLPEAVAQYVRARPESPRHPGFTMGRIGSRFVKAALPLYTRLVATLCQNYARQYRTFVNMLPELDKLCQEADRTDGDISQALEEAGWAEAQAMRDRRPFRSWAVALLLRTMTRVVALMLRMELIKTDELWHVYRYYEYLLRRQAEHTRARRTTSEGEEKVRGAEAELLEMLVQMAEACRRLSPSANFSAAQYDTRFRMLQKAGLTIPYLAYEECVSSDDNTVCAKAIMQHVTATAAALRQRCGDANVAEREMRQQLHDLARTCVANGLVLTRQDGQQWQRELAYSSEFFTLVPTKESRKS